MTKNNCSLTSYRVGHGVIILFAKEEILDECIEVFMGPITIGDWGLTFIGCIQTGLGNHVFLWIPDLIY